MEETTASINLNHLDHQRFQTWGYSQDYCVTCGLCASACPVSGVDGFDPRKLIRMVSLGMEATWWRRRWPWICTMCGKCEHLCPMGIDIADADAAGAVAQAARPGARHHPERTGGGLEDRQQPAPAHRKISS